MPGGTFALNVGGKEAAGNHVSGAIVGGTGKYNGAVGNFNSKGTGGENSPETLTFNYILPYSELCPAVRPEKRAVRSGSALALMRLQTRLRKLCSYRMVIQ